MRVMGLFLLPACLFLLPLRSHAGQLLDELKAQAHAKEAPTAPPVGLSAPAARDNAPLSEVRELLAQRYAVPKAKALAELGPIKDIQLRKPDRGQGVGVIGGSYRAYPEIPDGKVVGSGGAGPCVGLILIAPAGKGPVHVFHFSAMDDPESTLRGAGPFPEGTRAALFGGDGSEPSDVTLGLTLRYLRAEKLKIDGYSDTFGLWVDKDGRYYVHPLDLPKRP